MHIDTPPSDPSFASDVVEECEHMFVNQQYLLVGMPGVLVLLEYFRWDKLRHFVQLASIVEAPPRPQRSDVPFDGLKKVHLDDHFSREARDALNDIRQLGHARRRPAKDGRMREARRWSSSSSGSEDGWEDKRGLLSV